MYNIKHNANLRPRWALINFLGYRLLRAETLPRTAPDSADPPRGEQGEGTRGGAEAAPAPPAPTTWGATAAAGSPQARMATRSSSRPAL